MMNKTPAPASPAASQLAVEQTRASLALTAAEMGEFEWDVERDVMLVSERMAAITGMPPGEGPGKRGEYPLSTVHADDRDNLREFITSKLVHESRYTAQYRIVRPDDGRVLWLESSAVVLRDPDGAPLKII